MKIPNNITLLYQKKINISYYYYDKHRSIIILEKSKCNVLLHLLKLNSVIAYFSTDLFLLMQNDIVKNNEMKIEMKWKFRR